MAGGTIQDWPHRFLSGSDLVIVTGGHSLCFTLQFFVADLAGVEALHSYYSNCAGCFRVGCQSICVCMCQSQHSDERHAPLECSALTYLRDKDPQLLSAHISMRCSHGSMLCSSQYDLSLDPWIPFQLHSDRSTRIVKCRALSGCCVATNLVACPGSSLAGLELIPLGGRIGSDTAAVLPSLKLGIPLFFLVLMWTMHMSGS